MRLLAQASSYQRRNRRKQQEADDVAAERAVLRIELSSAQQKLAALQGGTGVPPYLMCCPTWYDRACQRLVAPPVHAGSPSAGWQYLAPYLRCCSGFAACNTHSSVLSLVKTVRTPYLVPVQRALMAGPRQSAAPVAAAALVAAAPLQRALFHRSSQRPAADAHTLPEPCAQQPGTCGAQAPRFLS